MKVPPCPFNEIVGKIKMLSMEARTSLSEEELAVRLRKCFGKGGLGLGVKMDIPGHLAFEGEGGTATAAFCTKGGKTILRIVTREWAAPVKTFVTELP